MRLLWFANCLLPEVYKRLGLPVCGSGFWMSTLLRHMPESAEIAVVTALPGLPDLTFKKGKVEYILIGQRKRIFTVSDYDLMDLRSCIDVVNYFKPDLIHVHGTERFFGLLSARGITSIPTLVSLQGILGACRDNFWGGLTVWDRFRFHGPLQFLLRRGLFRVFQSYNARTLTEEEVLRGNKYFAGRTSWDLAHLRRVNCMSQYFKVGEILREEFYNESWSLDRCRRQSIIFTNASAPLRGAETLLRAISYLRQEFREVHVQLLGAKIGNPYTRFLKSLVEELELGDRVQFSGYFSPREMVSELQKSHIFVITSFVENSPNSLCEAQVVGLPCVASFAGGIPDLVEHGQTGLLFPVGDAAMLAARIRQVFNDDRLAERLGCNARKLAVERHRPELIVKQLLKAYEEILGKM
jgi:glycosyltransferase involved in cell wall biosynthesis